MSSQMLQSNAEEANRSASRAAQHVQQPVTSLRKSPAAIAQRKLQQQADNSPQVRQLRALHAIMAHGKLALQRKKNETGLPDNLKSGVEQLSGLAMDDVKVHYNSSQPAQLNALAYAQGTDIHVAPGQEQHLPHEAWHVAQQKQGRVKPTMQLKESVPVNDDPGLEHEADVMGAKAMQMQAMEEEPLQGKFETAQREAMEEEPLQGKFETAQREAMEEEPLQGKFEPVQRETMEEEPLQGKFETAQREAMEEEEA
jgi:Domain of unknown function (DUF4157)